MFFRFIFSAFLIFISVPATATEKEDPFAPKLYDISKEETFVRFVTKMCTADIIKGEFKEFSGQILFDQFEPEKSWVDVTIDASSLQLDKEFHGDHHIKTIIEGEHLIKAAQFTTITLKSTKIERTSENTGIMTADMTFVGETRPITLEITFENTMTDRYAKKIGADKVSFSAYGTFKRSDWNVLYGLDRIGIRRMSDEVQVFISATANLHHEQK